MRYPTLALKLALASLILEGFIDDDDDMDKSGQDSFFR
jgi:hypothetical protein